MTDRPRPPIPYDYLPPVPSFTVTSEQLSDGKPIDQAHVGGGGNTSPQLRWEGFPAETKSFAVTMYDPDAPTGSGFWHWVLFDIPASVTELPLGAASSGQALLPEGAVHARNDAGGHEYVGPFPPAGHGPHRYVTAVHALDVEKLGPDESASPAVVGINLWQHTLARAVIVPVYEEPG